MTEGNTGINALIGGIVTIVTAPIFPLSPIVGGAVAGYLQRGDLRDGGVVGAIAGGIALVPLLLGITFLGSFLFLGPMAFAPQMGIPGGVAVFGLLFLLFALLFFALYTIGFAALGGAVGAYVATETDIGGRSGSE